MGPVKQYTAEHVPGPLTIVVYRGADGAFDFYEDDGESFDYEHGAWMGLEMRWSDRTGRLSVSLARGSRMVPPTPRELQVRLAGSTAIQTIQFDGRPQSVSLGLRLRTEAITTSFPSAEVTVTLKWTLGLSWSLLRRQGLTGSSSLISG